MSQKGILFVVTSPKAGQEDEYHEWYNNTHLPEVLAAVDGLRYARRFAPVDLSVPEFVPGGVFGRAEDFVAIYDVEADDLEKATEALFEGFRDGTVTFKDVLQLDPPPQIRLFRQIAECAAE